MTKPVSVRLSDGLRSRMQSTAAGEGITVSAAVRALIAGWVEDPHPVFLTTNEDGVFQFGGVDWWAKTMEMTLEELIGAILARAQVLEEFMRHYIAVARRKKPRQIKGTFGVLKGQFANIHPGETELLAQLETAKEVRNEAAHSDALVASFVEQALTGNDPYAVDRFVRKGVRDDLYLIQEALAHMVRFSHRHPLEYSDERIPRLRL